MEVQEHARSFIACMFMHKHSNWSRRSTRLRSGLGQAEVAVSTVIVGVLMVASFSTVASSRRSQVGESNKVRGVAIAEAMLAEITQLPMRDPACDCGFGIETGESGGSRINFDDIDDYCGFVDSPLKSKNGSILLGYTGFTRTALVDTVSSANWNVVESFYAGIYRITVIVTAGNAEVCRLVTYRTSASSGASSVAGFGSTN